jgi:enolase
MASKIPNSAKANIINGTIDLNTSDIRARLVMTNTTCDTEVDAINTLANYTTIDPADASGYADVALTTETVNADDANDRANFLAAAAIVFSGLGGNATRNYQGILLYKYVDGTNANDIPLAFVEFTAAIAKEATQVTVPASTTNLIQVTQG